MLRLRDLCLPPSHKNRLLFSSKLYSFSIYVWIGDPPQINLCVLELGGQDLSFLLLSSCAHTIC